MTEAEWSTCADPLTMLEFLRGKVSERKLRLFAVACWVHSVHFHGTQRERQLLLAFHQFVEGQLAEDQVRAMEQVLTLAGKPEWAAMAESAWDAAMLWVGQAFRPCQLLRDIFGNPFRPVADVVRWRSSLAVSIAIGIYADDAFDYRLPILADALEDAGCTRADMLDHCRGPGPHVQGCWVVDLVMGKE